MNNLGKMIEKRLKLVEAKKNLSRLESETAELRGELDVLNAISEHPVPLWTRRLAMEKRRRELVAGGDVLWKPVDSTARRVVQKAPWWSHQIPMSNLPTDTKTQKPGFNQSIIVQKKPKPPMKNSANVERMDPKNGQYLGQQIVHDKTERELGDELAREFVKRTDTTLDKTEELMRRTLDARAAMDSMSELWKKSWLEFQDESDNRLKDFRMFRMAMDTESRQLMAAVRDVRQFFLDKDYETERSRLKEFVELCERLKALKESGFLDTVAETMLGLSAKP